jgi:hypothetical protein
LRRRSPSGLSDTDELSAGLRKWREEALTSMLSDLERRRTQEDTKNEAEYLRYKEYIAAGEDFILKRLVPQAKAFFESFVVDVGSVITSGKKEEVRKQLDLLYASLIVYAFLQIFLPIAIRMAFPLRRREVEGLRKAYEKDRLSTAQK